MANIDKAWTEGPPPEDKGDNPDCWAAGLEDIGHMPEPRKPRMVRKLQNAPAGQKCCLPGFSQPWHSLPRGLQPTLTQPLPDPGKGQGEWDWLHASGQMCKWEQSRCMVGRAEGFTGVGAAGTAQLLGPWPGAPLPRQQPPQAMEPSEPPHHTALPSVP